MSEHERETNNDGEPESPADQEDVAEQNGRQNIRSTIGFPYGSLQDAEQVANALRSRGDTAPLDEVAAEMRQTTTSGAFRNKISTARTFGVIQVARGVAQLTALGHRLVDPTQAEHARAEAFLHVPLFSRVYEEYRGRNLPPSKGLEAAIERFGVSPKQSDKARQALQRSADYAGFFQSGRDRLVAPRGGGVLADEDGNDRTGDGKERNVRVDDQTELPQEVAALMKRLLIDGAEWPDEMIKSYLAGARTIYSALADSE